jgi:biotin operon repressor
MADVAAAFQISYAHVYQLCRNANFQRKSKKTELMFLSHHQRRKKRQAAVDAMRKGRPIADVAAAHQIGVRYLYMLCCQADPPVKLSKSNLRAVYLEEIGKSTKEKFLNADWSKKDGDLAKEFGVSRERIRQIKKGLGKPSPEFSHQRQRGQQKFLQADWNKTDAALGEEFGMSGTHIWRIRKRLGKPSSEFIRQRQERQQRFLHADWTKSNAALGKEFGLSRERVWEIRRTLGKPSPKKYPRQQPGFAGKNSEMTLAQLLTPQKLRKADWQKSNVDLAYDLGIPAVRIGFLRKLLGISQPNLRHQTAERRPKSIPAEWMTLDWRKSNVELAKEAHLPVGRVNLLRKIIKPMAGLVAQTSHS